MDYADRHARREQGRLRLVRDFVAEHSTAAVALVCVAAGVAVICFVLGLGRGVEHESADATPVEDAGAKDVSGSDAGVAVDDAVGTWTHSTEVGAWTLEVASDGTATLTCVPARTDADGTVVAADTQVSHATWSASRADCEMAFDDLVVSSPADDLGAMDARLTVSGNVAVLSADDYRFAFRREGASLQAGEMALVGTWDATEDAGVVEVSLSADGTGEVFLVGTDGSALGVDSAQVGWVFDGVTLWLTSYRDDVACTLTPTGTLSCGDLTFARAS